MVSVIHPTAVLIGDVEHGDDNEIGPYSVLFGPLKIGNRNWIGPHVTIGTPGQDSRNPRYNASDRQIVIGDDNIIREYCGIHKPCYRDITRIGNRVFLMQSVHVNHDALIHDDVVIAPMVVIGGVVRVLAGANLGMGCSVHQHSVVGHYTMIAMGANVIKNVRPFLKYIPGKKPLPNEYAIQKYGFDRVRDEVFSYVDDGLRPSDPKLQIIIDEFLALDADSNRKVY